MTLLSISVPVVTLLSSLVPEKTQIVFPHPGADLLLSTIILEVIPPSSLVMGLPFQLSSLWT